MTTTLERLEEWGCELARSGELRDPIGRPAGVWDLVGAADYLDAYIDPDVVAGTREEVVEAINMEDPDFFSMDEDALSTKLDWRGYNGGPRGWATCIKLDKVWDYQRYWDEVTDNIDGFEHDDQYIDYDHLIEGTRDWFYSLIESDYEHLATSWFQQGGRSGGWLLYTSEYLTLNEADQLVDVYENLVPSIIDGLCREVATYLTSIRVGKALGLEVVECEHDRFFLEDGQRFEVAYPVDDDE